MQRIVLDFDLVYDGNADIQVSILGTASGLKYYSFLCSLFIIFVYHLNCNTERLHLFLKSTCYTIR